jgi:hypothetical protein
MKLVRNAKFMAFGAMMLLGTIACKKETIEDPIQDPTPTTQKQVKKGELVRINFPAGVSQPEYSGTMGGISISLLRETPNDVIFLVPTSLPTGNQELSVPALNNFAFTYEVSEAQLSQPVAEIIADLNTQFANYSATLGTSESDLIVQQGLTQYTTFINSTSEENKQIIATVYALNKSYIDDIINEDFSGVGKSNAWTLTKFAFAVSALGGGSWMLICGVGVEKAVGAAVAYIAFGKAKTFLSELRDEGVFQINLAIGGDLGDVNKNRADTLQYSPGQTVQTTIALAGRKITAGDANQGNNNLASFFNSFGGYNWYVDKANAALTWVNDNILFANFNLIQVETLPAESPTNQNSISNEEFQNLNLSFGSGLLSISNLTYLGSGNVQFKVNFSGQPSQLPVVTKLNFSLPGFFNTITGSFDVKVSGGECTLCPSGSGSSYLWSTNATTQCITVSDQGGYSVEYIMADSTMTESFTVGWDEVNQQLICP